MTQIATVTEILSPGVAMVRVSRQTACGHDCENCGGCGAQGSTVTVKARCSLSVAPGDLVELTSGNQVLLIAALVYLVPILLFLLGYMIPFGLAESIRYICGGIGFVLGLILAVACDRWVRQKNAVTYQITRKL